MQVRLNDLNILPLRQFKGMKICSLLPNRNVTRQNCITKWEIDSDGNKVITSIKYHIMHFIC